jgi:hypothetical protein
MYEERQIVPPAEQVGNDSTPQSGKYFCGYQAGLIAVVQMSLPQGIQQ